MKAGAVATPLAFVVDCAVVAPPVKVPLAPLEGAVNVTVAPLTGLPPLSLTVACMAVANAVLAAMLCGVPAVGVILAAGPAWLVNAKTAGEATPLTVAFTL